MTAASVAKGMKDYPRIPFMPLINRKMVKKEPLHLKKRGIFLHSGDYTQKSRVDMIGDVFSALVSG